MASWMQWRIRSKLVEGNLLLFVLRLLREPLAEWEALDSLYRSFGLSPDEREFEKLVKNLLSRGYLRISGEKETHRLRLSGDGVRLLSELEKEYHALLSKLQKRVGGEHLGSN